MLLDADDDCPATKGREILGRASVTVPHRKVAVVMANREYEAWFMAAAASLNGCRGFKSELADQRINAEVPRNAKGWIAERIVGGGYHEATDQPAFSARLNLELAYERSRSFRKLCSEWSGKVAGAV